MIEGRPGDSVAQASCAVLSNAALLLPRLLLKEAALLTAFAGRIYDDAPQQNANPLGRQRMPLSKDTIEGLLAWLAIEMGTSDVAANAIGGCETLLFRARAPDGHVIGEIEISEEALEDYPPEDIIADLRMQGVPARLKRDATMRLFYGSNRKVPEYETRVVVCNGRTYTFTRDATHTVRAYDGVGRLLQGMPSPLPVKPTSIFRRDAQELCEDARGWDG